ncbi:MAG: hypothetical protein ACREAC_07120, partial [Blastocatellia bacterium]
MKSNHRIMKACSISTAALMAFVLLFATPQAPVLAQSQGPAAVAPYTVTVFAKSVTGQYTQPDSIAVLGSNVFIGYGNGVATDGSDGKSST